MDDYGLNDDGSSIFDPGFSFNPPPDDSTFMPQPISFGPDPSGLQIDYGPYDPSGGAVIPGTSSPGFDFGTARVGGGGGANLGVPSDPSDGSSGGFDLGKFLQSIGFGGGGAGGQLPWAQIIGALLSGGAGALARNATNHATDQAVGTLNAANDRITGILGGGANSQYAPYADLGKQAATQLGQLPMSNLAGNFNPLGTGRGIKLGSLSGH